VFQDQQAQAVVSDNYLYLCMQLIKSQQGPWNQEKFEKALMEWIIACDQPFDEVEKPEFIALMIITHHTSGPFKIPKRDGIKRCVMKMGEETIEGVQEMFQVLSAFIPVCVILIIWQTLEGKVCLSLDAWTSSNQHAFMAIVAHYITNNGQLGLSFI
jgi:hypothetical protein